jgi:hypothetical protein
VRVESAGVSVCEFAAEDCFENDKRTGELGWLARKEPGVRTQRTVESAPLPVRTRGPNPSRSSSHAALDEPISA